MLRPSGQPHKIQSIKSNKYNGYVSDILDTHNSSFTMNYLPRQRKRKMGVGVKVEVLIVNQLIKSRC